MAIFKEYIFKLSLLLIILYNTSCIPYKYIDIQYLNKPEITIPLEFNKAIILANYYSSKENNKRAKFETAIDSVAIIEATNTLFDQLVSSPSFQERDLAIQLNRRTDSSIYINPLPWSLIDKIGASDSADLIISLEYLNIKPDYQNIQKWNGESIYYYGFIKYQIYAYWRIYDLYTRKTIGGSLHKDTLIWDSTDWTPVLVGNQIPGYFSCAEYVGYDIGLNYARKIAPIWNDDSRVLYIGKSKIMKVAADLAENGEWLTAAEKWQLIYKNKKGRAAAKAAFNLALANEMMGYFNYSLDWLKLAKKQYPLPEIDNYEATLKNRISK